MDVYQDKLRHIVSLGEDVWIAEYEFNNIDRATRAGHIVIEHVPQLRTLAASLKADLVVSEFADCSRLFFGGLLSDESVSAAHGAVLDQGGRFFVAHQPPGSTLILTATGVDRGTAPTFEEGLVAHLTKSVESDETAKGVHAGANAPTSATIAVEEPTPDPAADLRAERQPNPAQRLQHFFDSLDPNDWCLEYRFEFHITGEHMATRVLNHPWIADLVQAGRANSAAIEIDGQSFVHIAGRFNHIQLIGIHKWMTEEGVFRRCRPPANAGAEERKIQRSLFGMPVEARPWWKFWA